MSARTTGMGGHQSADMQKDEWLTPPDILKALGPFDLDPCAPISPPWPLAARNFTLREDGLSQPWEGFVWCNPPYGKQASPWLERMAIHRNGLALIFARTETEMFFDRVWLAADAVLFVEGRFHFHHADGTRAKANSGAPSVIVAYGEEAVTRLEGAGVAGCFIKRWRVIEAPELSGDPA